MGTAVEVKARRHRRNKRGMGDMGCSGQPLYMVQKVLSKLTVLEARCHTQLRRRVYSTLSITFDSFLQSKNGSYTTSVGQTQFPCPKRAA